MLYELIPMDFTKYSMNFSGLSKLNFSKKSVFWITNTGLHMKFPASVKKNLQQIFCSCFSHLLLV